MTASDSGFSHRPTFTPHFTRFTYTGTGRLASYATSAGVSASYSYDAAGQRTRSVVTSGSVTTTTTYTYEGLNLLSLAAEQSTGTTYSVSYLYDAEGRPYAGVYASGAATPTVFQVVTTDRGDVVELLDTAGTAFAAYRYDAWGVPTETTSTAAGTITSAVAAAIASRQPLRYAGYAYDEHSGLYYLSARSYDPVTRQFLSKDPAKDDGEESAYQYCGGDPVEKVDPSGEYAIWRYVVSSASLAAALYSYVAFNKLCNALAKGLGASTWLSQQAVGKFVGGALKSLQGMLKRAIEKNLKSQDRYKGTDTFTAWVSQRNNIWMDLDHRNDRVNIGGKTVTWQYGWTFMYLGVYPHAPILPMMRRSRYWIGGRR